MNDGGCHYNLGFQPGTVVTQNYCEGKGSGLSGSYWGEYDDEGSAYVTDDQERVREFWRLRDRKRERRQQHGTHHLHK